MEKAWKEGSLNISNRSSRTYSSVRLGKEQVRSHSLASRYIATPIMVALTNAGETG